jgi:exonuclease I
MQELKEQSAEELVKQARTRLDELKEEMKNVAHFSSFNQKKTPTAVFNYLTSIVEKHLNIVPQQPILYGILIQLREDELLRCLFNISIYLGTLDKPEVFIAELKQLYEQQEKYPQTTMQQLPVLDGKVSKKDRKKINAMLQQQQQSQIKSSNIEFNEQIVSSTMLILKKS